MSKAIVSGAGTRMARLLDITACSYRAYAAVHGYDVLLHRDLDGDESTPLGRRAVRWAKLPLIRAALERYDVVLWIDADAMFRRVDRDIVDDLPAGSFQGLVVEKLPGRRNPNTGVWLLRANPMTFAFLEELVGIGQQEHSWADQAALCVALGWSLGDYHGHGARPGRPSRFRAGTAWLPREWNALGTGWPARGWIVHLAGMGMRERIAIMRQAVAALGMDGC